MISHTPHSAPPQFSSASYATGIQEEEIHVHIDCYPGRTTTCTCKLGILEEELHVHVDRYPGRTTTCTCRLGTVYLEKFAVIKFLLDV